MATVIVTKKDGTRIERSPVDAVLWAGGNIIILGPGVLGGRDTDVIDDINVSAIHIKDVQK